MMDENNQIDDLYRSFLGNYSKTPSVNAWDKLNTRLMQQKFRRNLIRKYSIICSCGGLFLLALLLLINSDVRLPRRDKTRRSIEGPVKADDFQRETTLAHQNLSDEPQPRKDNKFQSTVQSRCDLPDSAYSLSETSIQSNRQRIIEQRNGTKTSSDRRGNLRQPIAIHNATHHHSQPIQLADAGGQKPSTELPTSIHRKQNTKEQDQSISEFSGSQTNLGNSLAKAEVISATSDVPKDSLINITKPYEKLKVGQTSPFNVVKTSSQKNFRYGLKLTTDNGIQNNGTKKWGIGSNIDYSVAERFQLSGQLLLKFGTTKIMSNNASKSYYNLIKSSFDSSSTYHASNYIGAPDTILRTYYYKQNYDSIIIYHSVNNRTSFEFSLPIICKFKIANKISLTFGVAINYLNSLPKTVVQKHTYNVTVSDTDRLSPACYYFNGLYPDAPPPKSPDSIFLHSSQSLSEYKDQSSDVNSVFYFSFLEGVHYNITPKFFGELMFTQNRISASKIPDNVIRQAFNQNYVQFSIGYMIR